MIDSIAGAPHSKTNMRLNFNHLYYFWIVAQSGSLAQASSILHVTPQTISGQLRKFEERLGTRLFQRSGRKLALTETGRVAMSYAERMFEQGDELKEILEGGDIRKPLSCNVGVAMVVPKLIAYRVLQPILNMDLPVRLLCHEAPLENLLADLAVHKLDLILTDSPMNPAYPLKAYNHLLGTSEISFFAARRKAARYRKKFPGSLHRAPFLLPTRTCALRDNLMQWFSRHSIQPRTVAEFEDTALMNAFGEAGAGVYCLPTSIESDIQQRYRVSVIGRSAEIKERFYLISPERRLRHAAVLAIMQGAKSNLQQFSDNEE